MDDLVQAVSIVVIIGMVVHMILAGRLSARAFLASLIIPLLAIPFAYLVLPRESFDLIVRASPILCIAVILGIGVYSVLAGHWSVRAFLLLLTPLVMLAVYPFLPRETASTLSSTFTLVFILGALVFYLRTQTGLFR